MIEGSRRNAGMPADPRTASSAKEARRQARKRVLLGARVSFLEGSHHFDCTIRDLSDTGARITLPRNQPMPSQVYLINMRDRVAYEARVVRNTGMEAGLSFVKILPLAELTDPKLAYLKKLWHDRVTR